MFPVCVTGDVDRGDEVEPSNLLPLLELLAAHGVRMTVPVTSSVLPTHAARIERILDAGHEVAGHGDVHVAFRDPVSAQVDRLLKMKEEFQRHLGFQPVGFRAPYLEHSRETYTALHAAGFRYDSSRISRDPWLHLSAAFGTPYAPKTRLRQMPRVLARHFLGRTDGRPYLVSKNVVELPVFELDDWYFLDSRSGPHLGVKDADVIASTWLSALDHMRRDARRALILQAHPARMSRGILRALERFLELSKDRRCMFLTLSELMEKTGKDPRWQAANSRPVNWV